MVGARDNPGAALSVVQQVLRQAGQITVFPNAGRRVADYAREDVRELIEGQYRIVYRVGGDRIDVLTVKHCAQVLPPDVRRMCAGCEACAVSGRRRLACVHRQAGGGQCTPEAWR